MKKLLFSMLLLFVLFSAVASADSSLLGDTNEFEDSNSIDQSDDDMVLPMNVYYWEITDRSDRYAEFGPWTFCAAAEGQAGGTLGCSKSVGFSEGFSGALRVTYNKLEGEFGYSFNRTSSTTTSYTHTFSTSGYATIEYRHYYFEQDFWQQLKSCTTFFPIGCFDVGSEVVVTPRHFVGFIYRVV